MDRRQLAKECERIEKDGGSVREYLAARGCISPWGTWYRLQKEQLGRHENQITDGKGGDDMKKIALADKKKAVEIAIGGGDPLAYLKKCGSRNPQALWYVIRKNVQEAEPETYARLLNAEGSGKKAEHVPDEEPKQGEKQEPEDKKPTVSAEDVKKAMEAPTEESLKHPVVAMEDDFKIYGLKTRIGDFQAVGGRMNWYKTENEIVSMPVEDWKKILEIVPKVLNVMGL